MPKDTRERVIDSKSGLRGGAGGLNTGGAVGVTDHGALTGLGDDDHLQYHTDARGDLRYVPLARTVTAGAGLTGGGDLSVNRTLAVGAGEGISVAADTVGLASSVAGAALSYTAGVLAVVPGEGLEIETDAIGLAASVAGDGLTYAAGVLNVGTSGLGLDVTANAVRLTSDSDPDNSAAILATTSAGLLTLRNLAARQAIQSQVTFATGFAGSGWRADYGLTETGKASAEFDNLTIRGRMRVYELLIQQIRATNGSLFVSSASKAVGVSADVNPAWTVNGAALTFNGSAATFNATIYTINTAAAGDSDRSLYHGFLNGDLIRAQRVQWNGSGYDIVIQSNLEVTKVTDLVTYQAAKVSGNAAAVGYDFVRVGNARDTSRQGSVYITSDDSAAPFIDIVDGVRAFSDWNSANLKRTRMGKLAGISDVDFGGPLSGYGIYTDNGYFKGQIIVTGGNAATIGYVDQGLSAKASTIYVDAIAALKANLTYVDSTLAAAITPLAAITYVDDRVTHIDGGSITTGTINANRISAVNLAVLQAAVANLAALNANLGTVTAGSIVIGSGNKLWLNDLADGALAIGGTVKASAPFQVSAAGHLDAIDASFGTLQVDSSGAFISPLSSFNLSYGYKFKYGTSVAGGLLAAYSAGSAAYSWLLNNKPDITTGIVDASADSYLTIMGAAGSAKSSAIDLRAERIVSGAAKFTGLSLLNTSGSRKATIHADTFVVAPEAGGEYTIWHSNNDGPGSGLNADTLDGYEGADFARTAGSNTFSYETTFSAAVNFDNYLRLSLLSSAPAYQSGYALIFLLDGGSGHYQLRAKIRSADGTKYIDKELTTT